ncbi:MAG: hypothetical protein JST66_01365 [Bacteroidetes bacterium]|nr:hypothetical protein [Bacteroidota bacterium]
MKAHEAVLATAMTLAVVIAAYTAFGHITGSVLASGYVAGLIGWCFFGLGLGLDVRSIRTPFLVTLLLFALHKVEENRTRFQDVVATLTGMPVPELTSPALLGLLLLGVLPWLLVPLLWRRTPAWSAYFAWTFFASMGITELAHFLVFPFLGDDTYSYFPGMATALPLIVAGWWGMRRMFRDHYTEAE